MPLKPNSLSRLSEKLKKAQSNHAARHTPTGFRFALADDIRCLNAEHWDSAAAQGGLFMTRAYLAALADHAPENLSPRVALIYDGLKPVAAIAAQIVEIQGERVLKSSAKQVGKKALLKKVLKPLKEKAVAALSERVLVCGNLLSWGQHGVAFSPGVDPTTVWPAVAEALYRIRRADKLLGDTALLVIKDLDAPASLQAESLATYSYRPLETEPDMVLELPAKWRCYDDYLASLDAKYRKSAKQLAASLEKAGVSLGDIDDLSPHQEPIHALYLQVHHAATIRPVTIPSSHIPALQQALPKDSLRCCGAWQDGRLVGFVITLKSTTTAIGYFIGYDRELAAIGVPLYLALLHRTIAHALELGCERLSLGRTALEPKARLGAKAVPLHLWTRHRVPAMNWLLRAILQGVSHEEAPERNPFKG
jgi:hypothetical protein